MASSNHVTEKPFAPQNQQVLKCPRCNSSNTKFCYYNNYSLSQPRHFCKACKRYWTRGGTLRNVPVGGGCRKNKKIKRSTSSTTTTTIGHNPNPNPNPNLDHSTSLNNNINPLYGLLQQNPKYPRFNTDVSRYDLVHPHMSSLGLGFSSSLVSSYPPMFNGGSTSSDPMMASLIASGLEQQPRFMGFTPYGDEGGSLVTDGQIEGIKTGTNWSNNFNCQNDNDHINKSVELSDPTSFLWTTTGGDGGEWLDPTSNICSSVPSLI